MMRHQFWLFPQLVMGLQLVLEPQLVLEFQLVLDLLFLFMLKIKLLEFPYFL